MNRNMKLCLAVMKWRTIILADDDDQILFSASNISGQEKAIINFQGSFEIRISLAFQGAPFLEAEATSGRVKNELKSAAAMALQSNTELYESHFDRCHDTGCTLLHFPKPCMFTIDHPNDEGQVHKTIFNVESGISELLHHDRAELLLTIIRR